jgi:hypothetical protein
VWLLARCADSESYGIVMTPPLPLPTSPTDSNGMPALAPVKEYGGLHFSHKDVSALGIKVSPIGAPAKWRLAMTRAGGNLQEGQVADVILVLGYQWA